MKFNLWLYLKFYYRLNPMETKIIYLGRPEKIINKIDELPYLERNIVDHGEIYVLAPTILKP